MAKITGLKVQPPALTVKPKVPVFQRTGMTAAAKTQAIVVGTGIALVAGMVLVVVTRRPRV
jgi:hypothetical protein